MDAVGWCSKGTHWMMCSCPAGSSESVSAQERGIVSFFFCTDVRTEEQTFRLSLQSWLNLSRKLGWWGCFGALDGAGSCLGRGRGTVKKSSNGHPFSQPLVHAGMQHNWLSRWILNVFSVKYMRVKWECFQARERQLQSFWRGGSSAEMSFWIQSLCLLYPT